MAPSPVQQEISHFRATIIKWTRPNAERRRGEISRSGFDASEWCEFGKLIPPRDTTRPQMKHGGTGGPGSNPATWGSWCRVCSWGGNLPGDDCSGLTSFVTPGERARSLHFGGFGAMQSILELGGRCRLFVWARPLMVARNDMEKGNFVKAEVPPVVGEWCAILVRRM